MEGLTQKYQKPCILGHFQYITVNLVNCVLFKTHFSHIWTSLKRGKTLHDVIFQHTCHYNYFKIVQKKNNFFFLKKVNGGGVVKWTPFSQNPEIAQKGHFQSIFSKKMALFFGPKSSEIIINDLKSLFTLVRRWPF